MNLALDTNRYTDLARGEASILSLAESADHLWLPFVVVAELRYGFLRGTRQRENERWLEKFIGRRDVTVLFPDERTLLHYASVRSQLTDQGTPIPMNDLWIAALVIQHGLVLCTRDAHFDHLPQVSRV